MCWNLPLSPNASLPQPVTWHFKFVKSALEVGRQIGEMCGLKKR